jgi:hypothetical protein
LAQDLLIHKGVNENDARRTALHCYLAGLCEHDFGHLQLAAVVSLRKLDELGDDQDARLAPDEVLVRFLEARRADPT